MSSALKSFCREAKHFPKNMAKNQQRVGNRKTIKQFFTGDGSNISSYSSFASGIIVNYFVCYHSVNCDRPGECSPEKDCLW